MAYTPWVGVDFDGTLAESAPQGQYRPDVTGRPIEPMVQRVRAWLTAGHPEFGTRDIRIFSARACSDGSPEMDEEVRVGVGAVRRWCVSVFGRELPITGSKDYGLVAIYDDIAHHVVRNTGQVTS